MQARSVNDDLIRLTAVFASIEPYNVEDNIGFRSLKNLGVWLIAYALTATQQKEAVLKELAAMADPALVTDLQDTVNFLSKPEALTEIINDYEKANGKFTITVNNQHVYNGMLSRAREIGLVEIVIKYCSVNLQQDNDLIFEMNNTIKFNWRGDNRKDAVILTKGSQMQFGELGKINFMTTPDETYCGYDLVEFNSKFYHVARISVKHMKDNGEQEYGNVHFVQPVNLADQANLQRDYLAIIGLAADYCYSIKDFLKLEDKIKRAAPDNLKVTVTGLDRNKVTSESRDSVKFTATLHIPELFGALKTREERLGAYEVFRYKNIGTIDANNIFYVGERELTYNEKGGEIKNREVFGSEECARIEPKIKAHYEYTVSGPFMLVYSGNDSYAFQISDPTKNLEKKFSPKDSYTARAQAGAMFSNSASDAKKSKAEPSLVMRPN